MGTCTYDDDALSLPFAERPVRSHEMVVRTLRCGIQLAMRGVLRACHRLDVAGQEYLPQDLRHGL